MEEARFSRDDDENIEFEKLSLCGVGSVLVDGEGKVGGAIDAMKNNNNSNNNNNKIAEARKRR